MASIPGVLVLLDARGIVRFASGQVEHLGGESVDVLVGSELSSHLEAKDRPLLTWLLAASAAKSPEQLTGPVRLPYLHADGRPRLAEAWALNRLADPALAGFVVLLLLESAYDHFDQVLASAQAGVALDDNLSALAVALATSPGARGMLLRRRRTRRSQDQPFPVEPGLPGPPAPGPWDQAMGRDADDLVHRASGPARVHSGRGGGLPLVSCFPILTRGENTPSACLVVWSRELGPLGTTERTAVDRALILASLMMSHSAAGEPCSKRPLRTC